MDPTAQSQPPPKTNKPGSSAFKQQRLKAWQPILTPKTVLPTFFIVGLAFVPLGIGLYITSNSVNEIVLDYTNCNLTGAALPSGVKNWTYDIPTSTCNLVFDIPVTYNAPVYLYYRLTNYYQNHRRYVKSFSSQQLQGAALSISSISTDCDPIVSVTDNQVQYPIYPCGLIANSLFNDTFSPLSASDGSLYMWNETGIAWPSDKAKYQKTQYTPDQVRPPPNWSTYHGNYTTIPDISQNEHLMVWMRTAGLPNFRKLYGHSSNDLPAGTYSISIFDQYPVTSFSGTKSVVISTTSWLGGKNPFLGIAYIVVGAVCILLGLAFLIRHIVKPRKLGDQSLLSWNQ